MSLEVTKSAQVRKLLKAQADPEKAAFFPHFFKTGPGEYGDGDRFLGVTVPKCRKIARAARGMEAAEIAKLLDSPWHEEREVALFILVEVFKRAKKRQGTKRHLSLLCRASRSSQ